jgi:hypothetical protein
MRTAQLEAIELHSGDRTSLKARHVTTLILKSDDKARLHEYVHYYLQKRLRLYIRSP